MVILVSSTGLLENWGPGAGMWWRCRELVRPRWCIEAVWYRLLPDTRAAGLHRKSGEKGICPQHMNL